MKKVDYIIVGQGLAGSVLAHTLMQENQHVLIVDEDKETSSSKIAAGLCNPVVFKRLTKSWMIDDVLGYAKNFYKQQEDLLQDQFYFDIPIYKIFVNEKEQEFWQQKSNEPHLFDWINHEIEHPFDKEKLLHPFGAAKTLKSGFLKTAHWLSGFRDYLKKGGSYINKKFDYTKIELTEDGVNWESYQAKKIIFCEGYQCIYNPYFDWLPFKLTKGEILTVNFENLELKQAINKGIIILPLDGNCKLGSTYDWDNLDETPTEKGKHQLLEKAAKFINDPIQVLDHKAGVRPTVNDRRPLIGLHPKHKQLAVFNGLGTKGVMLAPYFANRLSQLILQGELLPSDVDIQRFKEKEA